MSQSPFQKFTVKKKNSVIKEEIRQEKKTYRKERNAFFEKKKEEVYIGGSKELFAIYLKRFLPGLFSRIIRKAKVR